MQFIHEQLNVCQKVKCALKPRSDERARDIFARTVASNAAQKLRLRKAGLHLFDFVAKVITLL